MQLSGLVPSPPKPRVGERMAAVEKAPASRVSSQYLFSGQQGVKRKEIFTGVLRLRAGVAAGVLEGLLMRIDEEAVEGEELALEGGEGLRLVYGCVHPGALTTEWAISICKTWAAWKSSNLVLAPRMPEVDGVFIRHSSASRYAFFSASVSVCLGTS